MIQSSTCAGKPLGPLPLGGHHPHLLPKDNNCLNHRLQKYPDTCVFSPSHPNILKILSHLFRDFRGFHTTTGQSWSKAVRISKSYLNDGTKVSGHPYAPKSRSVLAHISPAAILCHFRSASLAHWAVLGWSPFQATHGTKISKSFIFSQSPKIQANSNSKQILCLLSCLFFPN